LVGELAKQFIDSNTKAIVTLPIFMPMIQAAIQLDPSKLSSIKIIIVGEAEEDGTHSFFDMIKTDSKGVQLVTTSGSQLNTEKDTGALLYSSGTTGLPKGCMLTHSNIVNDVHQFLPVLPDNPLATGGYQEKVMGLLPFFHIMGLQALNFICVREGCHVVCVPKFEPDFFIHILKEHQVSKASLWDDKVFSHRIKECMMVKR
jgi:4-coumarate--CoA ligase